MNVKKRWLTPIKNFPKTYEFCNNDIRRFILLIKKCIIMIYMFRVICSQWCCGVVVITPLHNFIQQNLNSRFCTRLNPACSVSEVCNGKDLSHGSQLEIRLDFFHQSTIPQNRLIIIIMAYRCI